MRLFNTMTRKKEKITKNKIGFYFCGPTVYDFAHIGNFRAYVFADLLRRYLEYRGIAVKMVMNITDVDDKTIKGSRAAGIPLKEFTKKFEDAFFEDLARLKIKRADAYPRATEHIAEMVELIKALMKEGYAYAANDGVYYKISKFLKYGKLSRLKIKDLRATERIRKDEYEKQQINDFALWKFWDAEDGDVFWDTEIGKGRPGWHIECSAMSAKHLESIDVHGGGVDLIFPHHENEIAQSTPVKKRFAGIWVHCEHLLVDGKKMSKSLGNFYTLRDIIEKGFDPAAFRYLCMSTHYRSQMNFTLKALEDSKRTVESFNNFLLRVKNELLSVKRNENKKLLGIVKSAEKKFEKHMDNDLNTPQALSAVFSMMRTVNRFIEENKADKGSLKEAAGFIERINKVFDFLEKADAELTPDEKKLVELRESFRKQRDFKAADEIRSQLKEKGIILEDSPEGVRWRKINR